MLVKQTVGTAGVAAGTDFSKYFREGTVPPCHGGDRGFKSPRGRQ
jgi:hypothetical protein